MNERWKRIAELFDAALQRPVAQRRGWLQEECGGDARLRSEVEALLDAHDGTGILDRPLGALISGPGRDPLRAGPYEIEAEIGRGGMGVVYRAHDPRLDRRVALKFLPARLMANEEARSRFLAEAKAASRLDHPNICTIYDIGETEDGEHFIAMGYYDGPTLAERLEEGPLPIEAALAIALDIAAGLGSAHEAGIVHRDIKPSNVIFSSGRDIKILDFGLAKLEGDASTTRPGMIMGTPAYMSPEQLAGRELDRRTDIWSLGVLLYKMVTGRRPFSGETPAAIMRSVLNDEPDPIASASADAPEALQKVLERALAKRPRDRYATVAEFAADLRRVAEGGEIKPAVPSGIPRGSIKHPLTSFVGREREMEALTSLLGDGRLITLTGPAGTGKTRLALQAAVATESEFTHGAFFVPLAPISDPALVLPTVAGCLGIEETPGRPIAEQLERELQGRSVLLVLDNFEQVVEAAPKVGGLLEASPELRLLVTSRVPLRISGEQEFPLSPLELPETGDDAKALADHAAVRLFLDRARAVDPRFTPSESTLPVIGEICARLDGLPLAIELAAARIRLLSPEAMLRRLGRRFELLKGGPRDRPQRHQTLRQAIGWSYDLLDEQSQRFFRRLAAFVGGCTIEAADSICKLDDLSDLEVMDGLAALVDQSLLRLDSTASLEPRYFMLETIRAFGIEVLDECGELEAVRRTHAEYFRSQAERAEDELTGPDQPGWLDRLEADHDNFRAALAWSLEQGELELSHRLVAALWRFWVSRGHMEEGRSWCDRVLGQPGADGLSPKLRARAIAGMAMIAQNQGDNIRARDRLEVALELFRYENDEKGVAVTLNHLAWVECEISNLDRASERSLEALELNQQLGLQRGVAVSLNNLGWIANYRGHYRSARSYHERSLSIRRDIEDMRGTGFALASLAWAESYHGDFEQAEEHLNEAVALLRQVSDRLLTGFATLIQAILANDMGDHQRSVRVCHESLPLWTAGGNRSGCAWARAHLGLSLLMLGDLEAAEPELQRSLQLWQEIGGRWGEAQALWIWGRVDLAAGQLDAARDKLLRSFSVRQEIGDDLGSAQCCEALAELAVSRRQLDAAGRLIGAADALRERIEAPLPPAERPSREGTMAKLREGLGAEGIEALTESGRRSGPDGVIQLL